MSENRKIFPVLIVGAGLAGCIAALRLADNGIDSVLLSASDTPENANSWLAQGGIIYRSGEGKDSEKLAEDIFTAGHRLNWPEAVRFIASDGPKAVDELLLKRLAVPFDRIDRQPDPEDWDLTREGGHSAPRIIHCADHTGKSIMHYVYQSVLSNPKITCLSGYTAVDLLTSHHHSACITDRYQLENQCCGAYVLNEKTGNVETMLADATILATGGAGQVYLHTSNAPTANGAGIAMASRAFVRLVNMEFMQFHPTTLFVPLESRRFLITEALRGEGATLVNAKGRRFMLDRDERAELAPRDVVARCIVDELLSSGEPCVFIDATDIEQKVEERFPTVFNACLDNGIDMRTQLVPVVPAAHYFCGGILVDQSGRSSLNRLYSIGECSCTGVHGANRLASTSLLEALLWGKTAADDISARFAGSMPSSVRLYNDIRDWKPSGHEQNDDPALIAQDWASIRNIMWNYVGITRTTARLSRAFDELRDLSRQLHTFYKSTPLSKPVIDLFHGCQAAYLITQAALRNTSDMGCHHRI